MHGSRFSAIIFDIGRVLIRVDVARAIQGLAETTSLSPHELWSLIEKDPRWADWQEGRISARDWHLHMSSRLESKMSFEEFCKSWNAALDPEPMFEDRLFEHLGRRYRLALVSNTDPIHVTHLEANYRFVSHFPRRIYSCQVGATKPNPIIYRAVLEACRVPANRALYIDDVPAFVEGGRRLGMQGLVFVTPEKLRADLDGLGIETG